METFQAVLQGASALALDPALTGEVVDLLGGLLNPRPVKRLGSRRGGVAALRAHPWFVGFPWGELQAGALPAPDPPVLSGPFDVSFFTQMSADGSQDGGSSGPAIAGLSLGSAAVRMAAAWDDVF